METLDIGESKAMDIEEIQESFKSEDMFHLAVVNELNLLRASGVTTFSVRTLIKNLGLCPSLVRDIEEAIVPPKTARGRDVGMMLTPYRVAFRTTLNSDEKAVIRTLHKRNLERMLEDGIPIPPKSGTRELVPSLEKESDKAEKKDKQKTHDKTRYKREKLRMRIKPYFSMMRRTLKNLDVNVSKTVLLPFISGKGSWRNVHTELEGGFYSLN